MMRLLTVLMMLLGMLQGFAQVQLPDSRVIAISGIKIRATPGLDGERLISVPFGAALEVIDSDQYDPETDPDTVIVDGIKGKWLQVKYKGTTGYAFDGYFGRVMVKPLDEALVMLPFAGSCNTPFFNLSTLPYQYGLFKVSKNEYEVRQAKLSYQMEVSPYGYRWLAFSTNETIRPLYVMISQKPLPTGRIKGTAIYDEDNASIVDSDQNHVTHAGYSLSITAKRGTDPHYLQDVTLSIGGRTQVVYQSSGKEDDQFTTIWLDFIGDIDMDGKLDVMWTHGRYYYAVVELWLSSKAKGNELVGLAARMYESGCC